MTDMDEIGAGNADASLGANAGLTSGTDAGAGAPAPNVPTVGSFRTLGVARANSDNSLFVFDDGFEENSIACNPDGLCAVAGFVP
jgi:hypothetical protein